jgi:parallel beta-helix repeat protein
MSHIAALGALSLLFVLVAVPVLAQDEPPEMLPGELHSKGLQFVVEYDSGVITVETADSTEVQILVMAPDILTLSVAGLEGVSSTQVTISGLSANATLYKYVDTHEDPEVFVTDVSGAHTFALELAEPHLIMIQRQPSTIFLTGSGWSTPGVGTWDSVTRVATLTTDVTEMISISGQTNLTLDGAGHTSAVPRSSGTMGGVYVSGGSNITIKNLNITDSYKGVAVWFSQNVTVRDNTILLPNEGITDSTPVSAWYSPNLEILSNTVCGGWGMHMRSCNGTVITGNVISNVWYAIRLGYSFSATISDNCIIDSYWGLVADFGWGSVVSGNSVEAHRPLDWYYAKDLTVYNNDFITIPCGPDSKWLAWGYCPPNYDGPWVWYTAGASSVHFSQPPPVGGNYWSGYTGSDGDEDGFGDTPYHIPGRPGTGYAWDYYPYMTAHGCSSTGCSSSSTIGVSGVVSSGCGESLVGVTVTLTDGEGNISSTTTAVDGSYGFADVPSSTNLGQIAVTAPAGYDAHVPVDVALDAVQVVDVALACTFVSDISGRNLHQRSCRVQCRHTHGWPGLG